MYVAHQHHVRVALLHSNTLGKLLKNGGARQICLFCICLTHCVLCVGVQSAAPAENTPRPRDAMDNPSIRPQGVEKCGAQLFLIERARMFTKATYMRVIPKEEVFSLEDGETRTLYITSFHVEEVRFPEYSDPAWERVIPARQFPALRIEITEENHVPLERHYWIDSRRLIGLLRPMLKQPGGVPGRYRILKHGVPPKSHYEVWKEA